MKKKITAAQKVMSNMLRVAYLQDIEPKSLASLLGVSERTLTERRKNPSTLTMGEVSAFCEGTHTEMEDMLK